MVLKGGDWSEGGLQLSFGSLLRRTCGPTSTMVMTEAAVRSSSGALCHRALVGAVDHTA